MIQTFSQKPKKFVKLLFIDEDKPVKNTSSLHPTAPSPTTTSEKGVVHIRRAASPHYAFQSNRSRGDNLPYWFLGISLENTAACKAKPLTVSRKLLKVTGIVAYDEKDKRTQWNMDNEFCPESALGKANSFSSPGIRLSSITSSKPPLIVSNCFECRQSMQVEIMSFEEEVRKVHCQTPPVRQRLRTGLTPVPGAQYK